MQPMLTIGFPAGRPARTAELVERPSIYREALEA